MPVEVEGVVVPVACPQLNRRGVACELTPFKSWKNDLPLESWIVIDEVETAL